MIRTFIIFAALIIANMMPPAAAKADTLEWTMRNDYPYIVYVRFFSKTYSNRAWPGGDESYIFDDGRNKTVRLSCRSGEKICFGGFTKSRRTYWGVGEYGSKGCKSCCRYCGEYYSTTDVLN